MVKSIVGRIGRSIAYPLTRHPLDKTKNITWNAFEELAKLPATSLENFEQKIVLSNGAVFSIRTTSPRTYIRLNKDTTNSPIWWPHLETVEDESGEVTRFEQRVSEAQKNVQRDSVEASGDSAESGDAISDFFSSKDMADSIGMVTEQGTDKVNTSKPKQK